MLDRDCEFLVIDDNSADANLLRRYLGRISGLRFRCVHCTQAEQGVAQLNKNRFDCLFLDQQLGAVHGVGILREIRRLGHDVPVILFTGHGSEAVAVEAMRAGAQDYLVKDQLSPEHLQLALESVFARQALERSLAENKAALVQTTEERDRFFTLSPDMFCIVDWEGRFQILNPAWLEVLGYEQSDLIQMCLIDLIHADDQLATGEFLDRLRSVQDAEAVENRCRHRDGRFRWLRWNAVAQAASERIYATARDITAYRAAEEKMRRVRDDLEGQVRARTTELVERNRELEKYHERLRSLTSSLALAEERERRRLAMDLHDSIGQDLALAKGKLGLVKGTSQAEDLAAPLDEVQTLLDRAIQRTRTMTFELSPPILHELGLEAALDWLAEQFQEQHGLCVQISETGLPVTLKDDRRIIVFRAVRELLFNVVKHAQAQTVVVDIHRDAETLFVKVRDDGIGFDTALLANSATKGRGFGIFSIQERIDSLGGRMSIESALGEGVTTTLAVPWQDRRQHARRET